MRLPFLCCCPSSEKRLTKDMPLVQTAQGLLRGVVCDCNNVKYFAFKGIPYAKPPLGNLRFKAPCPPDSWEGERDATQHGPVCPQYNERLDRIEEGSEDCLYLNVYSKNLTPSHPLPVMVWIHGGAFYTGSGNSDFYGPEFFMEHDIILVTFNYRLEVLGFLCLDNEEVPGNAGLKDQVAALKWVKTNIAAFGGDSNNITIFGCSAGSACTSFHLISDMSAGLFDKAICQSGVCLNEWSYNLYGRQRAFQLGKLLGKETEDEKELIDFLKTVPVSSLIKISLPPLNVLHRDLTDSLFFGPVIEKCELKTQKFICEPPPDLIRKGCLAKVPLIIGYTSGEGMETARNLKYLTELFSKPGDLVPRELKLKLPLEKLQDVDDKVRKYYFQGNEITENMIQEVTHFLTDTLFAYNILRLARDASQHSLVYFYQFTAETERNYSKKLYNLNSIQGVCHADDLHYLYNISNLPIPLTDESKTIIQRFVKLWTSFATTGNPSINEAEQWKPFTDTDPCCYIIGNKFECATIPKPENFKFWDEIYSGIRP